MTGASLAGGFRLRGNNLSERLRVARLHCKHPQPRLGRNTAPLVDAFGMPRAPVCCGLQTRISPPRTPPSAVHRVPGHHPPRWSEPCPARAAKGGAARGGAGGRRWAGDTPTEAPDQCSGCGPHARHEPGGWRATFEAAIVTSERSGVVTMAAVPETAPATGRFSG